MLLMSLPLLLAQASPYASALPREIVEKKEDEARRRREESAWTLALPAAPATIGCLTAVAADPERSARVAREALGEAIGRQRVRAGLCLGAALSELERWDEARQAFADARDAAAEDDHASRARLGAMAGNAALAAGQPGQALALLAPAALAAQATGDKPMIASIALDRARALVAVGQPEEAASALAEAREADPGNAQAWLLSATLSRRQDRLIEAQAQIEQAAAIAPRDPEIGLEAGVIAVLAGNDGAARRSWSAVLAMAPQSPAASTARQYLAQLGPEPTPGSAP